MSEHIYTVEFRIFSSTLDPSSITREIGLEPCQTRTEGAIRFPGKVDQGMWAYNGFGRDGDVEWKSLEEGLTFVLDKLWPHREVITRYGACTKMVWWCGHFQTAFDGGPTLSSGLLKRLGEIDADLFIDNYLSAADEPRQ